MKNLSAILLCTALGISLSLGAFPSLRLELVAEKQLQSPTTITHASDGSGRLFICEQRGKIRIFTQGMLRPAPFLDLGMKLVPERVNFDERGLLGLAFHPQYAQSGQPGQGKFYVFYSAPSPNAPGTAASPVDCRSVVAEYRVSATDANLADATSERILLSFEKPQFNHNGGQLAFGPEGWLYFSTGDGGSSNDNNAGHAGGNSTQPTTALGNAQDLTSWMGKLHRIDPLGSNGPGGQYGIPADNPLVGTPGAREEIWCYGMRNPWRFTFDPPTGRLFCADVGQGSVEEIDLIAKWANFGWRNREGTFASSFSVGAPALIGTIVDPIGQYAHPGVVIGSPALPQYGVSITGGILYRGTAISGLQGKYVFGDYSEETANPKGTLLGMEEAGATWTMTKLTVSGGNPIGYFIQSFGQDEAGEIYVGAKLTRPPSAQAGGFPAGSLLKLVAAPASTTTVLAPIKDNTIYQESSNSNALGNNVFTGNTASSNARRALMKFDLSSIAAGNTINTATLTMTVNRTTVGLTAVSIHRLTKDWGATTSQASGQEGGGGAPGLGDATWLAPAYQQGPNWTTPGGDFIPSSAPAIGVNTGTVNFTGLAGDVQTFVDQPAQNFGWLLKGDESAESSSKRYASSQNPGVGPKLSVTYTAPLPPPTRRQSWERLYYLIGQFIDPTAADDFDGIANLLEYAWNFHPLQPTPMTQAFQHTRQGNNLEVKFWRDPRATDLTYILEVGDSLSGWAPVVTSTAGATPTGTAYQSESEVIGNAPLKQVTALIPITGDRNFVRLRATRP